MQKKTIIIISASIVGVILIVIASVLIAAAVEGKRIKIVPDLYLNGVDPIICRILWYSSLAANSHNTQLWKLSLNPNAKTIKITYDEGRVLNIVDPNKREAMISLGCYLESLIMAFNANGYEINIVFQDNENANKNLITLTYDKKQDKNPDETYKLMEKRKTSKESYKKDKLSPIFIENMTKKYSEDVLLHYPIDSAQFNYLRDNTMAAVKAQSANQSYRDELADWMRFSDKEAKEKLDGINGDMIGLTGLIKGFYYWSTSHKSAKGNKFANQGIDTAQKQVQNCGAFFIISGNSSTAEETINVGRITQRFWFDCAINGISLQPLSAMLELPSYSSKIQHDLGLKYNSLMIFRAGRMKNYGNNVGIRRNLRSYIEVIK